MGLVVGSSAAAWPTASARLLGEGVFRSHYASLDLWLPGPTPWMEALASAGQWVLKEIIPNVMIDLACLSSRTRSVLKYMM
jgi:hypothetical protein